MLATYLKRQTNRATCYCAVRSASIWTISLTGDDVCDGSANAQTRTISCAGQTDCFPARCIEYAECLEPRGLCPSALSVITPHIPELRISATAICSAMHIRGFSQKHPRCDSSSSATSFLQCANNLSKGFISHRPPARDL
jgi:hypothetical protein